MSTISPFQSGPGVLQSASTAIRRAASGVRVDAADVAASSLGNTDQVLSALIDARQQLLYTQAAAKMMAAADRMMGTLVDTHA